jgi:uncharacterized membrane protein YheB (UPF0754 family)
VSVNRQNFCKYSSVLLGLWLSLKTIFRFNFNLKKERLMSIVLLISIPLISALIGWVTNYLAIKMIFRPYTPIKILGFTIHGILPRRKEALAEQIGQTVEQELISHDDIKKAIDNPEFHKELSSSVIGAIETVIVEKLGEANPMIAMFLSGDLMITIKRMLSEEVEKEIPAFMEKMFDRMEDFIDFKEIVTRKVNEFDMERLEKIVYDIASKELKSIEILGAVLGFLVGLVQLAIFSIAS